MARRWSMVWWIGGEGLELSDGDLLGLVRAQSQRVGDSALSCVAVRSEVLFWCFVGLVEVARRSAELTRGEWSLGLDNLDTLRIEGLPATSSTAHFRTRKFSLFY